MTSVKFLNNQGDKSFQNSQHHIEILNKLINSD